MENMNLERRQRPRINDPLPILVRGVNDRGERFQFRSVVRDIGAGGLCAIAPEVLNAGRKLYLHVRFARADANPAQAPEASFRGVVLRSEERPDGTCMFAVSFLQKHVH
jgi:c-di-GMP-binding flagellar brake protein YcgR